MTKKTGLTKDAGWQFGLRKTIDLPANQVWDFLFTESGAVLWLHDAHTDFSTWKPYSHIRTKWRIPGWPNPATLQMRVIPHKQKATIAFLVENMLSEEQRYEAKDYWNEVMGVLVEELTRSK